MTTSRLLVILSLVLCGCAASNPSAQAPAVPAAPPTPAASHGAGATSHGHEGHGMMGQGMMGQGMMKDCPMHMEGVTVRMDEIEGGAALVFSTQGDVAELRRRVAHAAAMHQKHGGRGCSMMHPAASSSSSDKPAQP